MLSLASEGPAEILCVAWAEVAATVDISHPHAASFAQHDRQRCPSGSNTGAQHPALDPQPLAHALSAQPTAMATPRMLRSGARRDAVSASLTDRT